MNVAFYLDDYRGAITQDVWDRIRPHLRPRYSHETVPEKVEDLRAYCEYLGNVDTVLNHLPVKCIRLVDADVGTTAWLEVVRLLETMNARQQSALPAFNEKVQVVVPDLGLLAVRRVMVLTDECTDLLQEYLDSGWRILAVCPQPDQRRPDYVLGHGNRELK